MKVEDMSFALLREKENKIASYFLVENIAHNYPVMIFDPLLAGIVHWFSN